MRPGSWAVAAKRLVVTARKLSSHPVTVKDKGCGERKRSKEERGTDL